MNSFHDLSYFEVRRTLTDANNTSHVVYISAFPSTAISNYSGPVPEVGTKVFTDLTQNNLQNFITVLISNKFGLSDTLWFLKDYAPIMNAQDILDWLHSLTYGPSVVKDKYLECSFTSTLDSTFSKKVYIKSVTLPQEALDTVIVFTGGSKITTLLGKKVKSPELTIKFEHQELSVLKVGMYGFVVVGEHLEQSEKSCILGAVSELEQSQKPFIQLDQKQASAAIRSMMEETGISASTHNFTPYLIGTDTDDGRDPRYWVYDGYGYQRPSKTVVVVMVSDASPPENLPEPLDFHECTKGQLVTFDTALTQFCRDGSLTPAFPAHSKLITMTAAKLELLV
jgi:hypothetical protein